MIAAVGIMILCLSLLGFGFSYARALKTERDSLLSLIALVERCEGRISCFSQPINEIFEDHFDSHLERIGFLSELKRHGLSSALMKKGRALGISRQMLTRVEGFAHGLGKSYKEEQIRLCRTLLTELKKEHERADGELSSRTKLSLSLSAALSALTAILLL